MADFQAQAGWGPMIDESGIGDNQIPNAQMVNETAPAAVASQSQYFLAT